MRTWYEYRDAWAARPALAVLAVLAVLIVLVAIVETVLAGPLALMFVPGLALLYLHHILVRRQLDRN